MKKLFTLIIGLILLFSVSAFERTPTPRPFVLYFKFNGKSVEGLKITFTVNTESIIKETNNVGGVMVDLDLGYSPDFRIGKELDLNYETLQINCGFEICNKEYVIGHISTPFEVTYELSSIPVKTITCPDGTVIIEGSNCPSIIPESTIITTIITKIICGDGTEVEKTEDCIIPPGKDEDWINWIIKIVVSIFIVIAAGTGWKFYNGKVAHRHKGIVGYHDPNIRHTNPAYRHTLWKESPWRCIKDTKRII